MSNGTPETPAPEGALPPTEGTPAPQAEPEADRRDLVGDRRRVDRRQRQVPVPVERRSGGDRRQVERRRSINQYDLAADELEFVQAIHRFKERTGKAFPTWSDVLRILRELGYEKQA